ncbi:MAG TPA: hypothetical protein VFO36_01575, partial [Nitrospiraceae bacterium]|nr:hypothetical protein [Nitrospiraceae bacterium]
MVEATKSKLTFESGLERLFDNIAWHNPFLLIALAEIGGFAERAPEWLQRSPVESPLPLALHGELPVAAVLSIWRTLKTGSPDAVLAAVRSSVVD